MRPMMKVLYMAMAVALSCVVPAHSMSMQELQNTSRFEMIHGFGESGNGDGTFIDKDSIKASNGLNGTKQIALTQYVLMPAGDIIQEKQVLYTFNTKQSFANLIKKLDAHQLASYKDLWLSKQKNAGVSSSITDFKEYHIDGNRYDTQSEARDRRMATAPVDFGFAGYLLANRLYERVYGVQFDDVVAK
ncbi:MAG: hypothetical protein KH450_07830 [Veillonella sp.]|uniref:Uncharacterized protein n=3 Tax=Veillonellaceae TaxID=31977 RepID=A0A3A6WKJ3_9FIRM|nr:hypothetical protein [Veillonella sp.]RJY51411.1 hypothetical protein D2965_00595 [Veillonella atypica]MBS5289801.1 hypothetical protein [Veillonella sp.]MBS6126165.1 hypothetical protein [Veillonella sp.]MBS6227825.1 hypothetical protein [Veillonella sp.]